jgi:hypothetical protein
VVPPKPRNSNVSNKAVFGEKPRKGLEIDYQSTSTDDRRGSDSFGATLDPRD